MGVYSNKKSLYCPGVSSWKLILPDDRAGGRKNKKWPPKGKISPKVPLKLQNFLKNIPKMVKYRPKNAKFSKKKLILPRIYGNKLEYTPMNNIIVKLDNDFNFISYLVPPCIQNTMCYNMYDSLILFSVTLRVILELVTILGSVKFGRYFSLLLVTFQPKFSGSQVRIISKLIMMNVIGFT